MAISFLSVSFINRRCARFRSARRLPPDHGQLFPNPGYGRVADHSLGSDSKVYGQRCFRQLNILSPWIMYVIQCSDMRYEPEHKTRTRDRIVRNAARKLRAEGLSGSG